LGSKCTKTHFESPWNVSGGCHYRPIYVKRNLRAEEQFDDVIVVVNNDDDV